ncbi:MAG: peptidase C45 [Nonomuraea sp.]|nr:peptidase C45 [Nonomuraea sp.]
MTMTVFASPPLPGAARGEHLGASLRGEIQATLESYLRMFAAYGLDSRLVRDVGLRTLDEAAAWAPGLAEEVTGVAKGAALEPWQAAALNARSEVLAHARMPLPGECSTAVHVPPGGPPRTIQTWDWYDSLADVKLIWQAGAVKTFTEYGVLGKIGVNGAGIGLHFNLLQHEADGQRDGVPVHLVARRILEEATTLDEAEEIARSARVSASVALTVVSRWGARALELSPAGFARVARRTDGMVLHTNHFLDPGLARGERLGAADPDTYARHDSLVRRAPGLRAPGLAERAAALIEHREDGAALCCHPEEGAPPQERWQTLLVIGLGVERGTITFHDGSPCTATGDGWIRV